MQELATYLHNHDQQLIMMIDPPVSLNDSTSYQNGLNDDVYIRYSNGSVFVAAMWPGATSWVDWLHPNAQKFWTGQVTSFFDPDNGIDVDGIWIDMNDVRASRALPITKYSPNSLIACQLLSLPCIDPVDWAAANGDPPAPPPVRTTWPPLPGFPSDFQPPNSTARFAKRQASINQTAGNHTGLPGRNLTNPPYAINNTDGPLYANTIWPDLPQYGGYSFYDLHNLFASGMIQATRSALETRNPGVRPFVISRSTFAGSGNKTGHWTGK
jgi:alpha-glucosidase